MKNVFSILVISFLAVTYANAAEMDHSQMNGGKHHPAMSSDKPAMENKSHDMGHDMNHSMDHQGMKNDESGQHMMHGDNKQHMGQSMDHQGMSHQGSEQGMMHGDGGKHSGQPMAPKAQTSSVALKPLTQVPPSGKAREAGFDGTYTMEDTSVDHSLARRCALASRGLVMLDKAGWQQCGSMPEGLQKTTSSTAVKNNHQGMHH